MKRKLSLIMALVILVLSCLSLSFTKGIKESEENKNEYYIFENSIVKSEDRLNPYMADYAIKLFERVNDDMLTGSNNVYFAIIPDKEKYINENKALYDEFYEYYANSLSFATMIDVYDTLQFSDFYLSDPHIRQERLVPLASQLIKSMNGESVGDFKENLIDTQFVGSYSKHVDNKVTDSGVYYLSSDEVDKLKIEEGVKMYDFEKLESDEPYTFFLSGNQPIVTIKNENAENDKRLVVFRDSFFSNLAPILATAYKETVVIDLRFVMSEYVGELVDFENADVLFIYSTLLLNNSMSMK
ncbi:MAG: hypothetical protein IJ015_06875 [Ruminococcus sp.]|nr:hypothetical protein [Ruminococcus sp.]